MIDMDMCDFVTLSDHLTIQGIRRGGNIAKMPHSISSPDFLEQEFSALGEMQQRCGPCHPDVARIFISIGLYYHHMLADHTSAIQSYRQALEIFENERDKFQVGVTLTDIGNAFEQLGNIDEAYRCYSKALNELEDNSPRYQATERCLKRVSKWKIQSNTIH